MEQPSLFLMALAWPILVQCHLSLGNKMVSIQVYARHWQWRF